MASPPLVGSRSGRSARSCREQVELLLLAADQTSSPAVASNLRVQALEWRKLAMEAGWQEAVLAALDAVGAPPPGSEEESC